jgi:competence protein ComEC
MWLSKPTWRRLACVVGAVALVAVPTTEGGRVVVIDVGQGDATLLDDPDGSVLVDTGGWNRPGLAARVLVPALAGLGVRRLDAVVVTHGDRDHCGALSSLLDLMPVGAIWTTLDVLESDCMSFALAAGRASIETLRPGDLRTIGSWSFLALHPEAGHRLERNDASLVLLAKHGGTRVLLTGDIEVAAERRLIDEHGEALKADVLKVAHHGSKTSTSSPLLEAVKPRLALISAGVENRYGHPAKSVLERLAGLGIPVLRSDRSGMIVLHLADTGRLGIDMPGAPR